MSGGYAIYIGDHPLTTNENPFGKDVANRGLFRALAAHGSGDDQLFLVHQRVDGDKLGANLFDGTAPPKPIRATTILNHDEIAARGALFRGQARLAGLAWMRRERDERAYSIVGLVHSLAPVAMRAYIAEAVSAPLEPWDALICTSPAVERHLRGLLEDVSDYFGSRFSGDGGPAKPLLPQLPVIPLGVDCAEFAAKGDPARRDEARRALDVAEDAFALLWVGRLSFYEKAYPHPMFAAAEEAARRLSRPVEFLMAGWFPDGDLGRQRWEEAARVYAPNVRVRFLDGNDSDVLRDIWATADVFVSLVDNIQETFGITPIEAMAAGLPVVVSDWDGYRATVPHGVAGFRIPSMMAPAGTGSMIVRRHAVGLDSYQSYVAQVAAHVAVNVRAAAEALTALGSDKDLAGRMSQAARDHAKATFDWPVIAAQYTELHKELEGIRASAGSFVSPDAARVDPVRADPFTAFADFASSALGRRTVLRVPEEESRTSVAQHHAMALNQVTSIWRQPPEASDRIVAELARRGPTAVEELAQALGQKLNEQFVRHLVWMCKVGLLDWDTPEPLHLDRPDPARPGR